MVQCEAQLGSTGNPVGLIRVLGSSTKLKSVMQLWVARQSSSSIWPVFCLPEPWQRESEWGWVFIPLCVAKSCADGTELQESSSLLCLPRPQTEVGREELRI